MKILLVTLLFTLAAQALPSCESRDEAPSGFVDDKYVLAGPSGVPHPVIIIGATEYEVDWAFYRQVSIGDLVKFENGRWIIVRKSGA